MRIQKMNFIVTFFLLDTVSSLMYLTTTLLFSLLLHPPLKEERMFSGLSWRMNCQLVNSIRLAYSSG